MKRLYKTVNDVTYVLKGDVYFPVTESKSSREKSWITLGQITSEFPEFFDKIEDIFSSDKSYNSRSKDYAESIMKFLELFGWLSWKQFDSIWRICSTYQAYLEGQERGYYKFGSVVAFQAKGLSFTSREHAIPEFRRAMTDRQMDKLHEKLFGCRPRFEEEEVEGLSVAYRRDGSRFFALPTGDEGMEDYMHFGINFKGLRI